MFPCTQTRTIPPECTEALPCTGMASLPTAIQMATHAHYGCNKHAAANYLCCRLSQCLHTCTCGQRSVPGRHKLCLGRCMAGRLCSAAVDTLGRWRLRRQVSCICSAGSPSFTPSGHGTSLWLMKLGYLTTPACPAQSKSMNRTSTPPPSTILHVYRRRLAGKHSQTLDATAQEHAAENVSSTLTTIVSSTHAGGPDKAELAGWPLPPCG